MPPIKRALISVFDKTGIVKFAETLKKYHVEIISTGGTAKHLHKHGIQTIAVSDITSFPEILGGRVKTLHPGIFAGLLSLRDNEQQMQEIQQHKIDLIDLVVVNLYPFEKTVANPEVETMTALENIDIGGPCMIRAAAKNYLSVAVVTSPEQYDMTISELEQNNG